MRLTTSTLSNPGRPFAAPQWQSALAVAAGLAVVFIVDRATDATQVEHLYYLPIVAAAITLEFTGATVAAFIAIVAYHAANHHGHALGSGDSDLAQAAVFLAVGLVTAALTRRANGLRHLATTDDLTGLHNLRSFEGHLQRLIADCGRRGWSLSVLVADVDRLKAINDTHGHLAGAEAVRLVGHVIRETLPSDAVACRYGGDEFVVAVPGCQPERGHRIADAIKQAVHEVAPVLAGVSFPAHTLSVSVGVSGRAFDQVPDALASDSRAIGELLFRDADAALYRAKAEGRNRVARSSGPIRVARRPLNVRKGVSASETPQ